MCSFIIVVVPKTESDKITSTLPRNIHCFVTNNKSITTHIPQDYISYCVITGMCSCDLFHPAFSQEYLEEEKQTLIRKYKKKGWTENKIQRALSDHDKSTTEKNKTYGFRKDLLEWLVSIVQNTKGNLSIIIHTYSGDVETENFQIKHANVGIDNFYSYQKRFPRDTLVKINIQ